MLIILDDIVKHGYDKNKTIKIFHGLETTLAHFYRPGWWAFVFCDTDMI